MAQTLPISRLISVSVTLTPLAAQFANFSSLMVVTDNVAIPAPAGNTTNAPLRIQGPFSSITAVSAILGVTDPAYLAAQLYFSQVPQPANFYLGRWASVATSGQLLCGIVPPASLPMSNWTAITNGGFTITVDGGSPANITGLNLSTALNLNGVASIIDVALEAHGSSCVWNGKQFVFSSDSTGPTSAVAFLTAPTGGGGVVDISGSAYLAGTAATAQAAIPGIAAESLVSAVATLDGVSSWYGLMVASTVVPQTSDYLAVAGYIEGAQRPHIFGVTTEDATDVWNPASSTDIASQLAAAGYMHTFCMYSSYSAVAAAGVFGIAFSTNWAAANSAYTLMYKQIFGLTNENIGGTVGGIMDGKRCMYQAAYDNGATILGFGEMSGPAYFDEIHGTDWLSNQYQTNIFNVLQSFRKVPQTDPGEHLLKLAADVAASAGVNAGLLAPGQWNGPPIGTISTGDNLPSGYYNYIAPVATQAAADRQARKSNPIIGLVKLAGAVHTANVQLLINR